MEYEYKILNVLLKNKGFDTIARKNMDRKQTGRYDAYNLTYGNRPELFGAGSPTYSGGTTGSICRSVFIKLGQTGIYRICAC